MFNLFKRKPTSAEIAAVTSKCLAIAEGMRRSGKDLPEIQTFIAQTVAVTTDFTNHDAAALVNSVMGLFFKQVPMTGPLPVSAEEPVAEGQKAAVTKLIDGHKYVEVTKETHVFSEQAPPWKKKEVPKDPSQAPAGADGTQS